MSFEVLRCAGHKQGDLSKLTGVSERAVRRIEQEPVIA
jgi:hypothetical protein